MAEILDLEEISAVQVDESQRRYAQLPCNCNVTRSILSIPITWAIPACVIGRDMELSKSTMRYESFGLETGTQGSGVHRAVPVESVTRAPHSNRASPPSEGFLGVLCLRNLSVGTCSLLRLSTRRCRMRRLWRYIREIGK